MPRPPISQTLHWLKGLHFHLSPFPFLLLFLSKLIRGAGGVFKQSSSYSLCLKWSNNLEIKENHPLPSPVAGWGTCKVEVSSLESKWQRLGLKGGKYITVCGSFPHNPNHQKLKPWIYSCNCFTYFGGWEGLWSLPSLTGSFNQWRKRDSWPEIVFQPWLIWENASSPYPWKESSYHRTPGLPPTPYPGKKGWLNRMGTFGRDCSTWPLPPLSFLGISCPLEACSACLFQGRCSLGREGKRWSAQVQGCRVSLLKSSVQYW